MFLFCFLIIITMICAELGTRVTAPMTEIVTIDANYIIFTLQYDNVRDINLMGTRLN